VSFCISGDLFYISTEGSNFVLCAGYALAISSSTDQNTYPYVSEWHSKILTPNADKFCLELDASSSTNLQMKVNLLSIDDQQNTSTRTVFEVNNLDNARMKSFADISVGFQPKLTTLVRLVVYFAGNATLHHVSIQPSPCLMVGKCAFISQMF
jgi:hypothetical protein